MAEFAAERLEALLAQLTVMASQPDSALPLPISPAHDELDALAFAVNSLLGELAFANAAKAQLESTRLAQAAELAEIAHGRAEELRVAKETAEEANRAKSVFLSNISHELRTPVSLLVAGAELLAKKRLSGDEVARLAERLLRGAHVLVGLLDNVLDLAKIESGSMDVRSAVFSPAALLEDTRLSFESSASAKGLGLLIDMPAPLPLLMGDPQRIRQIMFNLVSNAIKYTSSGLVTISAELHANGAADALVLAVGDTGLGISERDRERLFLPFSRLDEGLGVSGTGLGLHLSSRIAAALGGSLALAWSAPGQGSRFEVRLPVEEASRGLPTDRPVVDRRLNGLHILLADDQADIRQFFGELLELEGARVMTAPDGEVAVALASAHDFDVVLLDVQMPVKTGLEALAVLREMGYAKPVLALTANVTRGHQEHCLASGFAGFIAKPVDLDSFVGEITRHASRRAD